MRRAVTVFFLLIAMSSIVKAQDPVASPTPELSRAAADAFDLPEPTALTNRKALWATHYYVYGDVQHVVGGKPLLNVQGANLGVSLSLRDWCRGAIEGTIRAIKSNGEAVVYNYAGRGRTVQVDCSSVIRNPSINVPAIGRSRYQKARGPFGDGVQNMILVPYRSIAVDKTAIPYGTVIYIPAARGREIRLPSGQTVRHDGYFFAADTGGAIKRNHIDVFGGVLQSNPFPNFIRSSETPTFDGYLITDAQILEKLRRVHTAP